MKPFLIIGAMWVAGIILLSVGFRWLLSVSFEQGLVWLGLAFCLMLLAWGAAMYQAFAYGEGGWVIGLMFLPGLVMWGFILMHLAEEADRWASARWPADDLNEPLGMRQARVVVEEIESSDPEW